MKLCHTDFHICKVNRTRILTVNISETRNNYVRYVKNYLAVVLTELKFHR